MGHTGLLWTVGPTGLLWTVGPTGLLWTVGWTTESDVCTCTFFQTAEEMREEVGGELHHDLMRLEMQLVEQLDVSLLQSLLRMDL